jgi:transposase
VSKARLVITAITKQGLSQAEAARSYGLSRAWVSRLMARYRREGEAAFEPRSRRPNTSPAAVLGEVVDLIVRLRKELADAGLDAGPDTIAWHLEHHHHTLEAVAAAAYASKASNNSVHRCRRSDPLVEWPGLLRTARTSARARLTLDSRCTSNRSLRCRGAGMVPSLPVGASGV